MARALILLTAHGQPRPAAFTAQLDEYDQYHAIIGGPLEVAPCDKTVSFYVHGEGKLVELAHNATATELWGEYGGFPGDDWLAGNVIVVGAPDADGDDTDVPDHVLARFGLA